jgi:hypothetical protein
MIFLEQCPGVAVADHRIAPRDLNTALAMVCIFKPTDVCCGEVLIKEIQIVDAKNLTFFEDRLATQRTFFGVERY